MNSKRAQISEALQDIFTAVIISLILSTIIVHSQIPSKTETLTNEKDNLEVEDQKIKTISFGELQVGVKKIPFEKSQEKVLIIDARDPAFFALGNIPNSINLPLAHFNNDIQTLTKELKESEKIIIYCSSHSCPDSKKLASKLKERGYKNLYVYPGGYQEWSELTQQ
jgi:rhodanese-related sulfurtransferase